jgi:hypothetical protein
MSRAIKGIDEDPKLNKALWHMTEVFRSQGIALSLTQFRWTDYRQPNSHCRPFTDFALHVDFTAVQLDAALDDHQTKTRAWTAIDVMPTMEGGEEPLSIGFWNADALVADSAKQFLFRYTRLRNAQLGRRRNT